MILGLECRKVPSICQIDGNKVFCLDHGKGKQFLVSDDQIIRPGQTPKAPTTSPALNAKTVETKKPEPKIYPEEKIYPELEPLTEEISSRLTDDIVFEVK